jgi:carbamoyltransferase
MIILGLNAFHADSSAALVRDGKLIAAAEEERFRRTKHWAGFPSQAIAYCLSEAGISLSDIDHIAFNQDSRANLLRKIRYFLLKHPNINLVFRRLRNRRSRASLPALLKEAFPGQTTAAAIHPVEHHLAHLSSAFHVCPLSRRSFG